ncbi:MAG: 4-hydroxy-3-methylbut-2-enyl diphosphate reductase [Phycisphaerae bacterium]|nr:4-hydroxy-3-methylbut-2-enyl diphosphate reductase [Phycisphaerae bacterium]
MEVKLAKSRGFCFGVEDAVEIAERALADRGAGNVIALGPVIHNPQVVSRLEEQGLSQTGVLERIEPGKSVLIRSHGARPETYEQARGLGLNIVDATCVLVKHAQDAVRRLHEEGYHVVMIGDPNHPEVRGVIGYAPVVTVIDEGSDLEDALPYRERLGIVAQTTHSPEHVAQMIAKILVRPYKEVKIINTLCLEVTRRQESALALCDEVEVMFVLGGLKSANTREMVRLCREKGRETHHLETHEQLTADMTAGKRVAGVTAGASTPEWVITEFVEKLRAIPISPSDLESPPGVRLRAD